jgi:Phage tail tube protein
MPIGSGLSHQFGMKSEAGTYGTRQASDHFVRLTACTFDPNKYRAQGQGIQSGSFGPMLDHYVDTHEDAVAHIEFDMVNKGVGLLMQALMGATATPTLINGTSYSQTHTLSDPFGKSLTIQQNVPFRVGTTNCQEINGARATAAEFSCGVGELLKCVMDFDGRQYDESQTLATASYVTTIPFRFKDMNVKLGAFGSEVSLAPGVRNFSCKVERPLDVADWTAGVGALKGEPVLNAMGNITGQLTVDFTTTTKAAIQALAVTLASTSLVIEFVGPVAISGSNFPTWRITLPSVTFDPNTADTTGPMEVTATYNFTWRYDGANLPVITIISPDTVL